MTSSPSVSDTDNQMAKLLIFIFSRQKKSSKKDMKNGCNKTTDLINKPAKHRTDKRSSQLTNSVFLCY